MTIKWWRLIWFRCRERVPSVFGFRSCDRPLGHQGSHHDRDGDWDLLEPHERDDGWDWVKRK